MKRKGMFGKPKMGLEETLVLTYIEGHFYPQI
jgi:hypothetical protein